MITIHRNQMVQVVEIFFLFIKMASRILFSILRSTQNRIRVIKNCSINLLSLQPSFNPSEEM